MPGNHQVQNNTSALLDMSIYFLAMIHIKYISITLIVTFIVILILTGGAVLILLSTLTQMNTFTQMIT